MHLLLNNSRSCFLNLTHTHTHYHAHTPTPVHLPHPLCATVSITRLTSCRLCSVIVYLRAYYADVLKLHSSSFLFPTHQPAHDYNAHSTFFLIVIMAVIPSCRALCLRLGRVTALWELQVGVQEKGLGLLAVQLIEEGWTPVLSDLRLVLVPLYDKIDNVCSPCRRIL